MRFQAIYFIIVSVLLLSCGREDLDTVCNSEHYVYPIQPGTDEWKKLNSHKAMVDACQIPQKTLKYMCTENLINVYLDYPLLFIIFAFDNTNDGLKQTSEEFNGFAELLRRNDCATILLTKYESINPADINPKWTTIEEELFKQRIQFIELTLAFEPLCRKLTKQERITAVKFGLERLEIKEKNNYSTFSKVINFYYLAKILQLEEYPPFIDYLNENTYLESFLSGFLISFMLPNDDTAIKNFARNYLTKLQKQ